MKKRLVATVRKFQILMPLVALVLLYPSLLFASYKDVQEYRAIEAEFVVTSVVESDFNGDAVMDHAIGYRTRGAATPEGGLLILSSQAGSIRPVFHVFFEGTYAAELQAKDAKLEISLVKPGLAGDEQVLLTWNYGKDFFFNDEKESVLFGLQASASTTLRGGGGYASNAIDNNLDTAWAEGVPGTGVGESLTLKLAHPIKLAMLGIFPGKSTDKKDFRRANRLNRGTLEIQTESDLGDESSALDFSDLGIDVGGETEELAFSNKPEIKFLQIQRRKAQNLIIKIDSVFLGDKDDDTYIAEVELVPLLSRSLTLDRAKKKAKKSTGPAVKAAVIPE